MSDPKYIDAEKLKRHYAWWDDEAKKIFDEIIDLQPAADVVEVVLCKDCHHRGTMFCGMRKSPNAVKDYSFCSEGERKNG